jgi:hypothetical protein
MEAIKTCTVHAAHPGNADTGTKLKALAADHFAYDLVSRSDARIARRKFSFRDVQVRPADATGAHLQQYMPGFRLRRRYVFNLEGRS